MPAPDEFADFQLFHSDDVLYRRVLKEHVFQGKVTDAHCQVKQWKDGLSCDWLAVTPPRQARARERFILRFTVGICVDLRINVQYSPVVGHADQFYNLAHCLLLLPEGVRHNKRKVKDYRKKFLKLCSLEPWPE